MQRSNVPIQTGFRSPFRAVPTVPLTKSASNLLLILLLAFALTLLRGLGLLSPDTTRAATTERRCEGKVDMLLRVETDDEGRNVDDLLADTDVALADENTRVVNRLGKAKLVDEGLEAALQEILSLQGQHVIELHAGLIQHTNADKAANEGIAFEKALGILLVEREKLTAVQQVSVSAPNQRNIQHQIPKSHLPGSTTDLGEGEEHTPDLTLVPETILADELQLGVPGVSKVSPRSQST